MEKSNNSIKPQKRLEAKHVKIRIKCILSFAVNFVQIIKSITVDSKVDDFIGTILCKLLPRHALLIRAFHTELETQIPIWLEALKAAESTVDKTSEGIVSVLQSSTDSSDDYNLLASKCAYYLSGGENGRLDWSDCRELVEEYYQHYVKKKN